MLLNAFHGPSPLAAGTLEDGSKSKYGVLRTFARFHGPSPVAAGTWADASTVDTLSELIPAGLSETRQASQRRSLQ